MQIIMINDREIELIKNRGNNCIRVAIKYTSYVLFLLSMVFIGATFARI